MTEKESRYGVKGSMMAFIQRPNASHKPGVGKVIESSIRVSCCGEEGAVLPQFRARRRESSDLD